jgi:hypothetical protein
VGDVAAPACLVADRAMALLLNPASYLRRSTSLIFLIDNLLFAIPSSPEIEVEEDIALVMGQSQK